MKTFTKGFLLSLIILVGIFAAACPKRTSIADIEANPSRFYNKTVSIAGTVQDSYGVSVPLVAQGGIYKISDGTGSIWVVTNKGVPSKGSQLGVKGKIQSGVSFSGRNYGLGLIEDDRRFRNR
ncbi:MAG TPA: hypothetical protein VK892_09475 [Pyrinomonadaceae bacterium]|nr:hypothetical protein [Pyrinomonadaceae bacterium]